MSEYTQVVEEIWSDYFHFPTITITKRFDNVDINQAAVIGSNICSNIAQKNRQLPPLIRKPLRSAKLESCSGKNCPIFSLANTVEMIVVFITWTAESLSY